MQDQSTPPAAPSSLDPAPLATAAPRQDATLLRGRRVALRNLFEREREERRGYRRPPDATTPPPAAAPGSVPDNCFSDD